MMDSEVVTKVNETENLKLAEIPSETIDKSSDQQNGDKTDSAEQPENVKENDSALAKSSAVTVKDVEVEVVVKEDEDETPQTATKATTTITVTKKANDDETPSTESETTTTTTTVVVTKNDNDEESASSTETTTTTIKLVAAKKIDDEVDSKIAPENGSVIGADSETAENQSVVIPEVSKDDVEQKVSASEKVAEESVSESESESEDEDEQPETEVKTVKVEDVKGQSNISAQPEIAAKINNTDVALDEKVSSTNKDINNQIENIISDIDMNIKAQEKITQLKEQELQLIQKQKELANQIHQQQILAQKLIAQNQLKEQELQAQSQQSKQLEFQPQIQSQGQNQSQSQSQSQYENVAPQVYQEYTKMYNSQEDSYDIKESSNVSRTVDLRKIFTPATDAPQILPKNHYHQYQQAKPATSPNILPAYSDAGKHRVQLNIHQDQLIEKYSKPGVQVVKSPWEAALQTGSASSAFLEDTKYRSQTPIASVASPVPFYRDANDFPGSGSGSGSVPEVSSRPTASSAYERDTFKPTYETRVQNQPIQPSNPQRELAYKPSVAQGWGGRNVELPRGLYVPKEISLASYAPPPIQARDQQPLYNSYQDSTQVDYSKGYPSTRFAPGPSNELAGEVPSGFPVSNFTSGFNSSVPPKQQLYGAQSYQKVPPSSMQTAPPVNFSPSPLSFDKLSKFQGNDQRNAVPSNNAQRYLNINKQPAYGVRNASPSPFGGSGGIEDRSSTFSPNQGPARSTYSAAPPQMTQTCSGSGQSFNNCARGWSTGPNAQRNVSYPKVAVAADRLPYSDF